MARIRDWMFRGSCGDPAIDCPWKELEKELLVCLPCTNSQRIYSAHVGKMQAWNTLRGWKTHDKTWEIVGIKVNHWEEWMGKTRVEGEGWLQKNVKQWTQRWEDGSVDYNENLGINVSKIKKSAGMGYYKEAEVLGKKTLDLFWQTRKSFLPR